MTDLIYAEFVNQAEVARKISAAISLLRSTTAAEEIKKIVVGAVQAEAPSRSGHLKRSVDGKVVYLPEGAFDLEISARDVPYLKWVIGGRGWVYPKRARALHWVSPSGGSVFSAYARPVAANPFHERAFERVKPQVEQRWKALGEMAAYVMAD